MASIADELVGKIDQCLKENYQTEIFKQLDLEIEQMLQIVAAIHTFYSLPAETRTSHSQISDFKNTLLVQIDGIKPKPEALDLAIEHENFLNSLYAIFQNIPDSKTELQKPARFIADIDDPSWLKTLKLGKRIGFLISNIPNSLANPFRKNKKKKPYWLHKIPLQNLAKKNLMIETILDLQQITASYYSAITSQYVEIKSWEEQLDKQETEHTSFTEEEVLAFKATLTSELTSQLDNLTAAYPEQFLLAYEKAGTLELPARRLADEIISSKIETAKSKWSAFDLSWKNTNYAFFEEWRLDLNINLLKHNTLGSLTEFQTAQFKKIDDYIGPEMDEIKLFIEEGIKTVGVEHESFQKELKRLNYQAVKKLDKEVVPRLCDKLSNQTVINLINKLEVSIDQQVEHLSDERIIVKTDRYDSPMKSEDLHIISPHELIAFEKLPRFKKRINKIKQDSFASLENTADHVKDLDHVITFSLSSAIAALDNEEDADQAVSIATEGLKRAAARLDEERTTLNQSIAANGEALEAAVNDFCQDIMELTFNENVRELRLRITKAKAAKQAKEVRLKLEQKMTARKKNLKLILLRGYNATRHSVSALSEKFVLTAKKAEISKQVSDFLLESQQAIDKLPLIYKRLYQIEALEDLELFEGRQEELSTLKKAFDSWGKGHYAATVILGEKWGGLTSFLNYALHEARFPYTVTRLAIRGNECSEEHFIQTMRSLFKKETFQTVDDIINHLNDSPKRVVVLEDIQNLYQRKVHGFGAMVLLFQLINKTYKNVFWVTSTTIYTWSYLQKTININEFFSYTIELKTLTDEQIISIIWKRNRISGFKILFEIDQSIADDKKFIKMDEDEQQEFLRNKFFSDLNVFAQSNISLALIYWLLSTKEIDESTITIGTFKKPNLNFLNVLSMNKLYALHALILHDGLTVTQLADVLNVTHNYSDLTLLALLEDGLLAKTGEQFMINPIVYRNTISLLKSRNLIH
ncbi:hypothetical protein N7E81_10310 [Reichenbachiella carrageenanivorans]|uniref:Uncharacterized protein n=1 Tax=Reichenbachiella carrageenanivorans TaxID=2979869 RepID=A0ABY6CV05_9BACT|nr:hypothetical protein [Reichenbachiella carrageenanivorans]UXX77762.1 hypothetical protein N7E81_10310 [Reichenbachiella carrageenanivorans]